MFTLLSFQVIHKGKSVYDCVFSTADKAARSSVLTSVIIGQNGSGKSHLLATVADFLRYVHSWITYGKSTSAFKYEMVYVEYILGGDVYSLEKRKNSLVATRGNVEIAVSDVALPSRVLALSFVTNDKFSFSSAFGEFYTYSGVRAAGNATYTSTIEKRLCAGISEISKSDERIGRLGEILRFLGMGEKIAIRYDLQRKTLFKRGIDAVKLRHAIDSAIERRKYRSYNLQMIDDTAVEALLNCLGTLRQWYSVKDNAIEFTIDCKERCLPIGPDELTALTILENIEFISSPKAFFEKKGGFEFAHTSSGEKSILYTMVGLLSNTLQDALILIDEPEISLHPAWQMKYIHLVKKILNEYTTSHCVLATHSHFMVSDLEPQSSDLISAKIITSEEGGTRCFQRIEYSTYAWSAENILYKIFNLRTTRNYYFEQEVSELLRLIAAKSSNRTRMGELIERFESLTFDASDPLNLVIAQAREQIGRV